MDVFILFINLASKLIIGMKNFGNVVKKWLAIYSYCGF